MLIVHYNIKKNENDYGVIEDAVVYCTAADYDAAVIAMVRALEELGNDDACVVAYERYDGAYSSNPEEYENASYAVVACEWDHIRGRHDWWHEEEVTEDLSLY